MRRACPIDAIAAWPRRIFVGAAAAGTTQRWTAYTCPSCAPRMHPHSHVLPSAQVRSGVSSKSAVSSFFVAGLSSRPSSPCAPPQAVYAHLTRLHRRLRPLAPPGSPPPFPEPAPSPSLCLRVQSLHPGTAVRPAVATLIADCFPHGDLPKSALFFFPRLPLQVQHPRPICTCSAPSSMPIGTASPTAGHLACRVLRAVCGVGCHRLAGSQMLPAAARSSRPPPVTPGLNASTAK